MDAGPIRLLASATRFTLGPTIGYVFADASGQLLCFVPEALVSAGPQGELLLDEVAYCHTGWSERNGRWALGAAGDSHVFPDPRQPVLVATPEVLDQVARWRRLAALADG